MSFEDIQTLINEATGLDPALFGANALSRAVRRRLEDCGLEDEERYFAYAMSSRDELGKLVDELVTLETWFFRNRESFDCLCDFVKNQWRGKGEGRELKILSIPCSTGEEPYSIAMSLIGAGVSPDSFRVDAVDICRRAINNARRGVYGNNSFRGKEIDFREIFFTRVEGGYQIISAISEKVNFIRGNLLDQSFFASDNLYDVIFCRNLLIYFADAVKERAVRALESLLAAEGLLFVGHAETFIFSGAQLAPIRVPQAFAFQKTDRIINKKKKPARAYTKDTKKKASRISERQTISTPKIADKASSKKKLGGKMKSPGERNTVAEGLEQMMESAFSLANKGRMKEAYGICLKVLNEDARNINAWFLSGLVKLAEGEEKKAEECLSKVIYLDPKHFEALIHLSLIMERFGRITEAENYRRRARLVRET